MDAIAILGAVANGFQVADGVGKVGKLARSLWQLIRDRLPRKTPLALPEVPQEALMPVIEPVLEAELGADSEFAKAVRSQAQSLQTVRGYAVEVYIAQRVHRSAKASSCGQLRN